MRGRSGIASLAALIALAAPPLRAQGAPPDRCAAALAAPTRDTIPLIVLLELHAYDPHQALPTAYQRSFGNAVRRHLVIDRPIGADLYEISEGLGRTAHLAMIGDYSATIKADGRVVDGRVTGGDRNRVFDTAILSAMHAIDSTDMLSMATAGLAHDDVDIRVEITTREKQDFDTLVPLFGFRTPLRAVTQLPSQIAGTGRLKYPANLRQAHIEGEVKVSFVLGADGVAEPGSLQVPSATHMDFVKAVVTAMPTIFFAPLQVEGCAVRNMVHFPFTFSLAR